MGYFKDLDIGIQEGSVQMEDYSTCVECKDTFQLKDGEMDFYVQKGLSIPKRCRSCRKDRKNGIQSKMRKGIIKEVECDHCYRLTEVPFVPKPNSTVYCRVCWEGIKNVGKSGAVYV